MKKPHKPTAVERGAGAAKLIAKIAPAPVQVPRTNTIIWKYSGNPSNLFWNVESSIDLKSWSVIISNASGPSEFTVKKSEPLRAYRLSGRLDL